jgi:hypothetical protein
MTDFGKLKSDLALLDKAATDIGDEGETPAWSDEHALRLGEAMRRVHDFVSAQFDEVAAGSSLTRD